MALGKKTGGREKGTANKSSLSVREKLARLKCEPIEGMATIAMNNLPCGVCRGEGKTRYLIPENRRSECDCLTLLIKRKEASKRVAKKDCIWCSGTGIADIGIRTCQSCYGTLYEACSPAERGKMYAELAQYQHTKLKAIEHTGPDGGAIAVEHTIVFVE